MLQMSIFRVQFVLTAVLVLGGWQASASDDSPEKSADPVLSIEFGRHIRPILQRRCVKCHGSDKHKGNLRLDKKEYVDRGGHTGSPILGDSLEQSELYRRITSDDDDYRMPKNGQPLSQAEVSLIKKWIEDGAVWNEPPSFSRQTELSIILPWLKQYLTAFNNVYQHVRSLTVPIFSLLILVLFVERAKRLHAQGHRWATGRARRLFSIAAWFRPSHYLVLLLSLTLAGSWMYFGGTARERHATILALQQQYNALTQSPAIDEKHPNKRAGPIPHRPKHPKQLAGVYYRGNDERDPRLFNGGYYRTATLRIWLCDDRQVTLSRGDDVTDRRLNVALEIEKANGATPSLFTNYIIQSTFLSRQVASVSGAELSDIPVGLETLDEGNRWVAYYPISDPTDDTQNGLEGMIYVYRGDVVGEHRISGQIHYGIRYDIKIEGGRIAPESEVWMGSLLEIGNLLFPPSDKIPIHEWFDFRPIPEIIGENTENPELLGVDDYIPTTATDPPPE